MARDKRLLFLDEDVDRQLARGLRVRGRLAVTIYDTAFKGYTDGPLVDGLDKRYGDRVVLVTANYWMPIENGSDFNLGKVALAVIDAQHPDGYHLNEWRCEVVHRWAHTMQEQLAGSILCYGGRMRPWTLQRRLWQPSRAAASLGERYGRQADEFSWVRFPGDKGHPADAA